MSLQEMKLITHRARAIALKIDGVPVVSIAEPEEDTNKPIKDSPVSIILKTGSVIEMSRDELFRKLYPKERKVKDVSTDDGMDRQPTS